jgi:hypothetical protein
MSDGFRAELYVKEFAKEARIDSDIPNSPEATIQLLDQYNQHNLTWARMYIERRPEMELYPQVNDWIDSVIKGQDFLGRIDEQFKSTVKDTLLDTAFSSDLIVKLNDNRGQAQVISIDVTVKRLDHDSKLRKVRGQREDGDSSKKFNPNRNYPKLRSMLGIDKHIVLILDAKQYPSYATLLTELYAVANQPSQTAAVNLSESQEIDAVQFFSERHKVEIVDPPNLWVKYSKGLSSNSVQLSIEVTNRAIAGGHSKIEILKMLASDPQYLLFIQKDKGEVIRAEKYASGILDKAIAERRKTNIPDGSPPKQQRKPGRLR